MWGIDIVPSWAARYRIRRNMLFSCSGAEKWRGQGEMPQHKTSRRCLCQPARCVPRDCCCCCYTFCKGLGALGEPYCKKKNKPTPVCFKTPGFISNWIRGSQTLILAGGSIDYVSLPLQTSLSPFCISSSALALLSRVTATASSTGPKLSPFACCSSALGHLTGHSWPGVRRNSRHNGVCWCPGHQEHKRKVILVLAASPSKQGPEPAQIQGEECTLHTDGSQLLPHLLMTSADICWISAVSNACMGLTESDPAGSCQKRSMAVWWLIQLEAYILLINEILEQRQNEIL